MINEQGDEHVDRSEFDHEPTGEQLIDWVEGEMGRTRVIRSHRRPRSTQRGPVALFVFAATVACGITATVYTQALADNETVIAAGGEFVEPTLDDLIERANRDAETTSRSERESPLITMVPLTGYAKAKEKKPPKPRWAQPTTRVKVTSCYGPRWGRHHKGIDFDGNTGDKIRSVGKGTVVQAGWRYSGLGYSVVVKHANGWMSLYGHMSKVSVRTGQKVNAGDLVGLMGSTGNSTGSHLHLGIAKTSNLGSIFNTLVNPAPWMKSRDLSVGKCK